MNEPGIEIPEGVPYDRVYNPHRWSGYALYIGMVLVMFAIALAFIGSL